MRDAWMGEERGTQGMRERRRRFWNQRKGKRKKERKEKERKNE